MTIKTTFIPLLFASSLVPLSAHAGQECLQQIYTSGSLDVGSSAADIATGDLDQDGDLDTLVAGASGLWLFENQAGLGFSTTKLNVGSRPLNVALGDMDGDGDLDALVALGGTLQITPEGYNYYAQDGVRLLTNDGAGHFTGGALFEFPGFFDSSPVAAFLEDLDGDGDLDAAVALRQYTPDSLHFSGGLWVFTGNGAGAITPQPIHMLPTTATEVCMADFDGDGHLDFADLGGTSSISPTIQFAYGVGDGTFVNGGPSLGGGIYAGGIVAGDWDGDGDADLATGYKYGLTTFINDGSGSFPTVGQSLTNLGYYLRGLSTGDIDGDGSPDLLAVSGGSSAARMLVNNGGGSFALATSLPTSSQVYASHLADTNGDGLDDPWTADLTTGSVNWSISQCVVVRYGDAKLNSLGCLPTMGKVGSPAIGGSGLTLRADNEVIDQPGVMIVGPGPADVPFLAGTLLVGGPWAFIPVTASHGSGDPGTCDGAVSLTVGTATLASLGVGTRLHVQVLGLDPLQADGTSASLSDGLWFEVIP
ncbi:FG-GAP repeat domain-containing protein [Engelhardtia mirabilis]|uniref:FG-GAP repeat protein n=1 Tax=Engelhardtia mirabilis TaxID=2528011 RepID=A0A518BHA2_9BACT|nr:FG-GAP repeat protein [Planctomycetes bacterium Pla133]QDV00683.1 FG-GAP repeat protein [Planctomycetes bacterium Pla86]